MLSQRSLVPVVALVVFLSLVGAGAMSCGGGHAETQTIRTEKGLGVAPLAAADVNTSQAVNNGGGSSALLVGSQQSQQGANTGAGVSNQASIAYPYPFGPSLQSQTGLTVPGYGRATVAADRALLTVYLGGFVVQGVPVPGSAEGPIRPVAQGTPVSDADVAAVVGAMKAAGVADSDIAVDHGTGPLTITATIRHIDAAVAVEKAAQAAAQQRGLQESSSVAYTVNDCTSLEAEALKAAISDAHDRGTMLAQALSVSLGSVVGSSYSTSSAGSGPNACQSGGGVVYPLVANGAATAQSTDVQLTASVVVTYAIK